MFINHNIASLNAQRHLFNSNRNLNKTLERLSSGLKINSGADDASGLAIAEKMAAQNAGLQTANQNVQDGQALYKIAEGALNQVNAMLTRMEELAVRATNGTLTDSDRSAIMDEVGELKDQINKIVNTTEYNTLKVLNGSMAVETHLSEAAGNSGKTGSLRIVDKPGTIKTGTYVFSLVTLAKAAMVDAGEVATSVSSNGVSTSGIININGIDISISAGDSVAAVASKINDVNDQTGVVAVIGTGAGGREQLSFVSGKLDDDAKNIEGSSTSIPILGYATVGSSQKITISGNSTLMTELEISGGSSVSTSGANAAGRIKKEGVSGNGVDMSADGSVLTSNQHGAGTYGLKIDTDLFNGGNGIYIKNGVAGSSNAVVHRSAAGDNATIDIDISKRLRLQIGANNDQSIYNGIDNLSTSQLGIGGSSKYSSLDAIDFSTSDNANISLKVIQKAIEDVTSTRSKIGATMNRLEYTMKTLSIQHENLTAAQARIQDADISAEMAEYTKQQILLQTGTAMLAQANSKPQIVLSLLK